ncbi:MAG: threonine synthase [Corynebacterium glucuronolyticum]|nr:threonine synthase [Corynebacterium glucuronolyticum]MDD7586988.1 threonine synthase [Mycobacteriaceae bacterium]MDY5834471.1 threonine synthase [Corynebacterium glucuronolyticum]
MKYFSTRDTFHQSPASFDDVLIRGLAPDGGLYLPESYPQLTEEDLNALRGKTYPEVAGSIIELYAPGKGHLAHRAYTTDAFDSEEIVPLTRVTDDLYIGHLSQGPTAAFKDMAMQLLGVLFEDSTKEMNILGATSGDTGSSAEYAMRGREGIRVFMLTPKGRMTPFQQAQMFSLDDPNIFNIAVDGVFDDCQDIVKAVSADKEFKETYHIGTVNSINWARLLAQVVYYVWLYLKAGRPIAFSVPTGNFGDICAGHIARQMGVPITSLIVATNENDVLDEFFRTGTYRPRSAAETLATSSPSMDISKASNFERFIHDLVGAERTAELFGSNAPSFTLSDDEMARVSGEFGFVSGSSTHADRLATIARLHADHGQLVDPHTADGIHVAETLLADGTVTGPVVCLETALPVKFAETIHEAIGENPDVPERFRGIESGERHVTDMPNDAEAVKKFIAENVR